jgi:hypothetical protein
MPALNNNFYLTEGGRKKFDFLPASHVHALNSSYFSFRILFVLTSD